MDTRNPKLPPGSFGDVDTRDTHPAPGDNDEPYPPIQAPGEAIYDGAAPALPPEQPGSGGSIEGDVTRESDGAQLNPPEREEQGDSRNQKPDDRQQ